MEGAGSEDQGNAGVTIGPKPPPDSSRGPGARGGTSLEKLLRFGV